MRRRTRHAMAERPSVAEAVCWVAAVTLGERQARRAVGTRAGALLALYAALGVVAASRVTGGPASTTEHGRGGALALGLGLTFGGYQLGRWLLDDRPSNEPSEPLALELVSLGVVVPLVEELIWGARVEPAVGLAATSAAFAVKHPVVDGRWRSHARSRALLDGTRPSPQTLTLCGSRGACGRECGSGAPGAPHGPGPLLRRDLSC